jgi:hypothetical protein
MSLAGIGKLLPKRWPYQHARRMLTLRWIKRDWAASSGSADSEANAKLKRPPASLFVLDLDQKNMPATPVQDCGSFTPQNP